MIKAMTPEDPVEGSVTFEITLDTNANYYLREAGRTVQAYGYYNYSKTSTE